MAVFRGTGTHTWKLMEASTAYIRGSYNLLMEPMEASDSADSENLHVFPKKLPLISMEVNLLPQSSMEIILEVNLLPPTSMEVSMEVI